MSEDQVRVACPACGQRFKLDPATVPEGGTGNKARCRGCAANFFVRREGAELSAVAAAPEPKVAPKAEPEGTPRKKSQKKKAAEKGAKKRAKNKPPVSRKQKAKAAAAAERPPRRKGAGAAAWVSTPLSSPAAAPFGLGDRIGRYEIEDVLARGGMGGIYKVYDPAANRHVALKVLVSTATDMDRLRFQREIQVQGNIQHPHIMPIFDSGLVGTTRYFTMELLKDPIDLINLTEMMHSGEAAKDPKLRPLATLEGMVRGIVLPVCRALHHANVNEGVLHRDIKPGNVLVDRNGLRPFVIDFGVSSLLDKKNARLAHLDRDLPVPLRGEGVSITGTLVFMPPEQARGGADKRGDVWALGALLQYLLTGEPPLEPAIRPVVSDAERIEGLRLLAEQARAETRFSEAQEFEAHIERIESGHERTVEDLRRDVMRGHYTPLPSDAPKGLAAVIRRALMPNPERRYRHALELHDDLLAWLEGRPVKAMVKRSGVAGRGWYHTRLFVRRHVVLLGVLLVLGVGGLLAAQLWPEETPIDYEKLATEHMERAETLVSAGRYDDARNAALDALRADPDREDVFPLLERLEARERTEKAFARARVLKAEAAKAFDDGDAALGLRRLVALEELLTAGDLAAHVPADAEEAALLDGLLRYARGEQRLSVSDAPAGCRFTLYAVGEAGGPIAWEAPVELEAEEEGLSPEVTLRPGAWILRIGRESGNLYLPLFARRGGLAVAVRCPIDPALVGADSLYVGAGLGVGPGRTEPVQALVWDKAEVTGARYAKFLASLSAEERRRRVPRVAGDLGALGAPLWDAEGDGFKAPANALRRPVEGISLYDAKAFARFEKKRLPTAAEWAWAYAGPDERLCAVGRLSDVIAGRAHVDRPLAGVADGLAAPGDRSPFGIHDMSGNVAEFTSTLTTLRGTNGWVVLGGSYLTPPAGVLVSSARVVPGWMPLQGVGIRLVREAQ